MTVVLVLVSAFFHALWNALLRVEPDKDRGLVAAIGVASLFACVIAAVRWSLGQVPFATTASLGWTLLAGAFEAVYFATLARALDRGPLGAVYTISRGGAVLVVWPLSILLFHELVTITSASGSMLVLGGLVLCGIGAHGVRGSGDKSGVFWAVLCAVSIAGYHLAYKAALLSGASSSASFAVSLSLSALISVVRIDRTGMRALLRTRWHRIVLMGIVCGGSFLILMEALALGGSGYVLTLRNTSVLFAAVLAYFIGERPAHAELVGAALVAGGAVLMAW
ncbi:MAG: DMT family transporter [Myxococcota bacterium]|nr:permease [Deltaproteobacteria bacterium]MDQ3337323.1 DMT family transporter [Myxococcota bacterium]